MPELTLNLTTTGFRSAPIIVAPDAARLACAVDHDDATHTWGNAVLTLQWTADEGNAVWLDFSPAITLSDGERGLPRIPVSGVRAVRWRTSTADSGADPSCTMDYLVR